MDADAFFSDADYEHAKWAFDEAFIRMAKHLSDGGTVIWPADGLGTGRALLAERAPLIWNYLERCREPLFSIAPVEQRKPGKPPQPPIFPSSTLGPRTPSRITSGDRHDPLEIGRAPLR